MHLYIGYNLNSNLTFVVQLDSLIFIEIQSNSSGFIFLVNPIIFAFVMLCLIVTPEGTAFAITTATEYETGYEIEFRRTRTQENSYHGELFPEFWVFPKSFTLCFMYFTCSQARIFVLSQGEWTIRKATLNKQKILILISNYFWIVRGLLKLNELLSAYYV